MIRRNDQATACHDTLRIALREVLHVRYTSHHLNLAIRGIEADLGQEAADTFHKDLHPDLRADYILANPPFNISDWTNMPPDPQQGS